MMPGVGFAEMVLLVLVAIVVIGPKDLPLMMRKFGRFTGKMRALAFEFKQGFDELGRQAELEELRKEVADLKKHTGLEDIERDLAQDRINLEKDVDSAMSPATPAPSAPSSAAPQAAHPAALANGAAAPAALPYAGLSADHPGYDAGEDFRIDGYQELTGQPDVPALKEGQLDESAKAPPKAALADKADDTRATASRPHAEGQDPAGDRKDVKQDTPA